MEKEASGCNQKDVDLITEKVAGNLVVKENQSFSDSLKESSTAFVNLSDTPYIPASMSNCPENYCRTSCCSKPVLPLGFTPKPVKPPSVKRVEFKEHDNKQDIEVEGHGKVTVNYTNYESEKQMKDIISLITKDLSEPYSIYTYRYFIHNWPKLSFLAYVEETCIGAIVCKLDIHKKMTRRGYIAMLAVDDLYRRHQIGSNLVIKAIKKMIEIGCDEVVLETEITNVGALRLYENLGFVRDKRLFKYYLNGVDALRLKLWLR